MDYRIIEATDEIVQWAMYWAASKGLGNEGMTKWYEEKLMSAVKSLAVAERDVAMEQLEQ